MNAIFENGEDDLPVSALPLNCQVTVQMCLLYYIILYIILYYYVPNISSVPKMPAWHVADLKSEDSVDKES